ncbi:hypothetical protein SAMN06298216_3465 [Spirosomataceae bacterium TFI 002]|nr:hypothetical protein SAMN06298216_3465 [Spirosomataceae bacterium TFI 002]
MKSELKTTSIDVKKSPSQQQYETLVHNIAESQAEKENLKNVLRKLAPRIQKELLPLIRKRTSSIRSRLIRLDTLADEIGVSKENAAYFEQFMIAKVIEFLQDKDFKDDDLVEIYKKYKGESPAPDLEDKLFERQEKDHQQDADTFEPYESKDYDFQKAHKDTKQEKVLTQDSKAVYMRLMKKFHPDLEQDELLKVEKTAIVQKITKAYKDKDFFKLLDLQFQYLDNDAQALGDELLKQYNNMLAKQLAGIKQEIEVIKLNSKDIFEDFFDHNTIFSERRFRASKKNLKIEIDSIEADTRESFKNDKGWFKAWVREIRDMSVGF